jgi:hypothetical protein
MMANQTITNPKNKMNDFKCKCSQCGTEKKYSSLKKAYLDGWNIGYNALCWDCQKVSKSDNVAANRLTEASLN